MTMQKAETRLYYYGARYYDPKISVWLSVDPLAAKKHNRPLTPYHFSANNPLNIIDPDGNDWFVNQESGETLYRPNLGKDDASTLGGNIAWFASNDDIELSLSDITDGQLVGSYLQGEFEGYDFSTGVSKKIMEKNEYNMVPTKVTRESDISRISAGPGPPFMGGQIFTEQGFENETWDEVTYAPENAYRSNEGKERVFFRWTNVPGGNRLHQKHIESYSYESQNSFEGWLQGIVSPKFLENTYLLFNGKLQDPSGVQKSVKRP